MKSNAKAKKVVRDLYKVGFIVLMCAWVIWMVWLLVEMIPDIVDGILTNPMPFYVILALLLVFTLYQVGVWAYSPDRPEYKPEDEDAA